MKALDDTKIIDLFFERDETAIRYASEKYGNRLRSLSHNIVKDRQTAEECENDTYLETVCLLSKLSGAKNTIDVKVDMDEMDVTSAETKATYEEIKAYVLEHTGLQVSNLYIAQVKRECGIIERENYNKAKSEDSRHPKCPEEKKEAILEALKHFVMI